MGKSTTLKKLHMRARRARKQSKESQGPATQQSERPCRLILRAPKKPQPLILNPRKKPKQEVPEADDHIKNEARNHSSKEETQDDELDDSWPDMTARIAVEERALVCTRITRKDGKAEAEEWKQKAEKIAQEDPPFWDNFREVKWRSCRSAAVDGAHAQDSRAMSPCGSIIPGR
ncbi:hypothetical protein ACLMJK_001849 [Lecanora helva]